MLYNVTMETIEFEEEKVVLENQIAFDLDNIPDEIPEEESSVLPEQAFSKQDFQWVANDTLFVVVRNRIGGNLAQFDTKICGRPMIDFVLMAGGGCETRVVDDNENIIEVLKNIQTQKPYMLVLYSDTPLMQKQTVYEIMDYFTKNRLNGMALSRGYCFKVDFLRNIDMFNASVLEKFDEQAFTQVKDNKSYVFASNIIQEKIIDFHIQNNVAILDRNSVVIDADVEIEGGVIIKKNNVLKGQTSIGKDCILQENNVLLNSIIGQSCELFDCCICDSKIADGKRLVCQDIFSQNIEEK